MEDTSMAVPPLEHGGSKPFSISCVQEQLSTNLLGRNIIYKESTGTTMDDAAEQAVIGVAQGTVFVAEIQTKARGSRSKKWDALQCGNLYVSFVLYRDQTLRGFVDRFDVEVASALAVLKVLKDWGLKDALIKWPNDICVYGHKVAGFLVEDRGLISDQSDNNKEKAIYILGIGLNVNSDIRRHPLLHSIATSILCELYGQVTPREILLAQICNSLEQYLSMDRMQIFRLFLENQMICSGHPVRVYAENEERKSFSATLVDVELNWNVVLRDTEGKTVKGSSRNFSLRPNPKKTVYIYCGVSRHWSGRHFFETLAALVDSSKTNVVCLSDRELLEGRWSADATAIVVGDVTTPSDEANRRLIIQKFVQGGGSFFGIRKGCSLLFETVIESADLPDLKPEAQSEEKCPCHISEVVFSDQESTDSKVSLIASEGSLQFSSDIVSPDNEIVHYDSEMNGATVYLTKYGSGRVCLCGLNLECTYVNAQDHFQTSPECLSQLRASVFERDRLVQNILMKLGIN